MADAKSKTITIQYDGPGPNCIGIKGDVIRIAPGRHGMPSEQWDKIKGLKTVKAMIKSGILFAAEAV